MAETDILNPLDWIAAGLSWNPNPSYASSRKATANRQIQRPRMGPWNTRDILNGGHIFSMSWIGTDLSTVQRIEQFYHSFKDGYFTYIDVDHGGRHFVGRFTSEPEAVETANGKWNVQGVSFEEVPTARMVEYPNDWLNDAHPLNVLDDFLNPRVALMQGAWITQISPLRAGSSANDPSAYEALDVLGAVGDWGQTQYVGWGFKIRFRAGDATLGYANVLLDGAPILTVLDLYTGCINGAWVAANAITTPYDANGNALPLNYYGNQPGLAAYMDLVVTNVPLDMHRVKIVAAGANLETGGTGIIFPAIEYIY